MLVYFKQKHVDKYFLLLINTWVPTVSILIHQQNKIQ